MTSESESKPFYDALITSCYQLLQFLVHWMDRGACGDSVNFHVGEDCPVCISNQTFLFIFFILDHSEQLQTLDVYLRSQEYLPDKSC